MYQMRLIGGLAYLTGAFMMVVNLWATIRSGKAHNVEIEVQGYQKDGPGFWKLVGGAPVVYSTILVLLSLMLFATGVLGSALAVAGLIIVTISATMAVGVKRSGKSWHDLVEGHSVAFSVLVLLAILVGGMVEIIPLVIAKKDIPQQVAYADSVYAATGEYVFVQMPYSPLELEGRDIYVSEGCYVCHSQMIRPFRHETLRYGEYSRAEEFIYDTPFQWGSKRTGPDLHRVGGRYANLWHYLHMMDPRNTSPGSNMPKYPHLKDQKVNYAGTAKKMEVLRTLGVPYDDALIAAATETALSQGRLISTDLADQDILVEPDNKLTALIAYLQRLGRGPQPVGAEAGAAVAARGED